MFVSTIYRHITTAAMKKLLVAAAALSIMPAAALEWYQGPRLDISGTEVPVGDLLKRIEAQTGYTFAYNRSVVDLARPVTIQVAQGDLKDVLDRIFEDSGFTYVLNGNHIILIPVKETTTNSRRSAPSSPRVQARRQAEDTQVARTTGSPEIPAVPASAAVTGQSQSPVQDLPVVKADEVYMEVVDDEVYMVIPGQHVVAMGDMAPAAASLTGPLPALKTPNIPRSPRFALKTNLLLDATTTMNLGFEVRIAPSWTMELTAYYNPWSWPNNRKFKSIAVQPEFRYWICDPFAGHFIGIHAQWAHYNFGNVPLGKLKNYRYQGDLYGAGLSYGYSWYIGRRWALEATIGLGYSYLEYQKFGKQVCGTCLGWKDRHYVGITKLGLNLSFLIK